jgi:hypothetical protein
MTYFFLRNENMTKSKQNVLEMKPEKMMIRVSLKEEINLSNLNNQSSLLLLSGIIYSLVIRDRYFSWCAHTFHRYGFQDNEQ